MFALSKTIRYKNVLIRAFVFGNSSLQWEWHVVGVTPCHQGTPFYDQGSSRELQAKIFVVGSRDGRVNKYMSLVSMAFGVEVDCRRSLITIDSSPYSFTAYTQNIDIKTEMYVSDVQIYKFH